MTIRMSVRGTLVGIIFGAITMLGGAWFKPSVQVVFNPTDSAPRGWYVVVPAIRLHRGDYVVARLPSDTAMLAAMRGYLPRSVPILKQIAAVTGQRVCVRDSIVYIDGVAVARTLDSDAKQRPLTAWAHCRHLVSDELFLLNPHNEASFDSRYFGPVDASFVRGRAIPLATWQNH